MKKASFLQMLKFFLFSISAGAIQAGSFTFFSEVFHWSGPSAHFVALVLSVVWNFTFNRKFTFKEVVNVPVAMLKVACFYAVFAPGSSYLMQVLTSAGINKYVAELSMMLLNLVLEFLYYKFVIFRKKGNKQ